LFFLSLNGFRYKRERAARERAERRLEDVSRERDQAVHVCLIMRRQLQQAQHAQQGGDGDDSDDDGILSED